MKKTEKYIFTIQNIYVNFNLKMLERLLMLINTFRVTITIGFVLFTLTGCTNSSGEDVNKELTKLQEEIDKYELEIAELNKVYEEIINDNNEEIEQLFEEIEDQKLLVKNYKEELASYQNFIEKAMKYLDENELKKLAKSEFNYKIEIDGNPIPSNGEIEIEKNNFEVAFIEEASSLITLQSELYLLGKISGEYIEHLVFKGIEPTKNKRLDGTVVTSFVYEFEDLEPNSTVIIEITDELKERLELKTNTIRVKVK